MISPGPTGSAVHHGVRCLAIHAQSTSGSDAALTEALRSAARAGAPGVTATCAVATGSCKSLPARFSDQVSLLFASLFLAPRNVYSGSFLLSNLAVACARSDLWLAGSASDSLLWLLQHTRSQQHTCPQHLAQPPADTGRCLQGSCSGMGWHFAHQAATLDNHVFHLLPEASCVCLLWRFQTRCSSRSNHFFQVPPQRQHSTLCCCQCLLGSIHCDHRFMEPLRFL